MRRVSVEGLHERQTARCCQTTDAMFTAQDLPESCFGVYFRNIFLIESSKDRLNACTEEKRKALVKLPRQKAAASSSL